MTIGSSPPGRDQPEGGELWQRLATPGEAEHGTVVTALPEAGSVLVRSATPPVVPWTVPLDVRPGPAAVCDGDRLVAGVRVRHGDGVRQFDTGSLPAIEDAVVEGVEAASAEVVRFGDVGAWRRSLPAATVDAVGRCVAAAVARTDATLLAWTAGSPQAIDRPACDVVLGDRS